MTAAAKTNFQALKGEIDSDKSEPFRVHLKLSDPRVKPVREPVEDDHRIDQAVSRLGVSSPT